jgi:hypothetical protein
MNQQAIVQVEKSVETRAARLVQIDYHIEDLKRQAKERKDGIAEGDMKYNAIIREIYGLKEERYAEEQGGLIQKILALEC